MVAKLDRLSRSVHDASGLMMLSEESGWELIALDAPVDTTTLAGRTMAQILSVFAELAPADRRAHQSCAGSEAERGGYAW
jgi:DNA invertase Pin-like site-specific DNA recombinase